MDPKTYRYLIAHPDLLKFVRYHPIWYRYLSRDPNKIYELPKEAKKYYGNTFPQRLEKVNDRIQMVNMLVQLAEIMKD